jgi:hypothetical protein
VLSTPVDQRVLSGHAASFSVTAAGTRPLAFQWLKDAHALPDATSPRLSMDATRPADAGSYQVVITNAYGAITSAPAHLEILVPPFITRAPKGMAVPPGGDGVLSVDATDDLVAWITLWTGPPNQGRLDFIDAEAPFLPTRFYRIRFTPEGAESASWSDPGPTTLRAALTPNRFNPRDHGTVWPRPGNGR